MVKTNWITQKLTQINRFAIIWTCANEDIERINEKANKTSANRRKQKILHDHLISINTRWCASEILLDRHHFNDRYECEHIMKCTQTATTIDSVCVCIVYACVRSANGNTIITAHQRHCLLIWFMIRPKQLDQSFFLKLAQS